MSFSHAVLEQFTAGVREAGHAVAAVDLYAIELHPRASRASSPSASPR